MNQLAAISDNKYFNIALCQKYFVNDILLRDKYRQNRLPTEMMKIISYINHEFGLF